MGTCWHEGHPTLEQVWPCSPAAHPAIAADMGLSELLQSLRTSWHSQESQPLQISRQLASTGIPPHYLSACKCVHFFPFRGPSAQKACSTCSRQPDQRFWYPLSVLCCPPPAQSQPHQSLTAATGCVTSVISAEQATLPV